MKVAILIHGFNVSNVERTVGKLRPYFERSGWVVEILNYGYVPFVWQLKKRNPKVAARLAKRVAFWRSKKVKKIAVVAHSNGCAISHIAGIMSGEGAIDTMIAVNPALKRYQLPCPAAKKTYVLHNDKDTVVAQGKLLIKVSQFLRLGWAMTVPWGEMGRRGYNGKNLSVQNLNTEVDFKPKRALKHSGVFRGRDREFFLSLIATFCEG